MLGPILHRTPPAPTPALELGPAQERIVRWRGPGFCVVLGSPATGATTALIEAVATRSAIVPASRLLVIARDRDAVKRTRAALAARLTDGALPTVTTFHGLAYALVRRSIGPGPDAVIPRLLSGAEEDARIREILRGAIADGDLPWPESLMAATATLGFANDLRAMLTRARELGIDALALDALGHAADVPTWQALGRLAEIDADVMALEGVVDYSRLLELAIEATETWPGQPDRGGSAAAPGLAGIWVDDFQEAGSLQRQLLRALTGPTTATMVMADPDIAAFGFRGGDRLGAMKLIDEAGAEVIVLDRSYSSGGALWSAYADARRQPALPGVTAADLRAYRTPQPAPYVAEDTVAVLSHDTWSDLAAWVADDLRRLHLSSDVAWEDIAVIARSTAHLEDLRRALASAGVPVTMGASDIPLPAEPAVATLLAAISAAIAPDELTDRRAIELITGPLLAMESTQVRRLARALRDEYRAQHPDSPSPAGMRLVRDLLVSTIRGADRAPSQVPSPGRAGEAAPVGLERVEGLGGMLRGVRALAEADRAPAEVLWQVWSESLPDGDGWSWPERLRRSALAGHLASGHDLDAVMALFATAERLSDRYAGVLGIRGLLASLEAQRLAAERVAVSAPVTPSVSLVTAHATVGRRWRHVVLVGAQEGAWPPSLASSSVLRIHEWEAVVAGDSERGIAGALRDAAAERMAQERRLFALAVSRASDSLAVAVVESDSEHPSRFVDDLGIEATLRSGRPPRPLTLDGMVSRLRSVAQDPSAPAPLRDAAIERLALLADARDQAGTPLVPRADPHGWWGVLDPTPGAAAVRPPDRPVPLSGSGLTALQDCPLRWFLSRVVRAEGPRGNALSIGSLVHAVAEHAARGDLPIDAEAMLEQIDRVWPELPFDAPWESVAERADVASALDRLAAYLRHADQAVAVEHPFSVSIPLRDPDGAAGIDRTVVLRGAIDRIELDAQGRVRLVDFKTMRHLPSAREVAEDAQLGVYQLAVKHGALDGIVDSPDLSGAALVQLRAEAKDAPGHPRVQEQAPLADDTRWILDGIEDAVTRVRAEDFPAIASSACRTCPFIVTCPAHAQGQEVFR